MNRDRQNITGRISAMKTLTLKVARGIALLMAVLEAVTLAACGGGQAVRRSPAPAGERAEVEGGARGGAHTARAEAEEEGETREARRAVSFDSGNYRLLTVFLTDAFPEAIQRLWRTASFWLGQRMVSSLKRPDKVFIALTTLLAVLTLCCRQGRT
jgi:hypothetical protein